MPWLFEPFDDNLMYVCCLCGFMELVLGSILIFDFSWSLVFLEFMISA